MARILVFNNDTDRMESYTRAESEPMPYNTNGTLKVREFRGSSKSNILWTTKRTMQSWNSQRYIFGAPIPVGFAFKRPYEGGHGSQSHDWVYTVEHIKFGIEDRYLSVFRFYILHTYKQNCTYPYVQNNQYPIRKKCKENNININMLDRLLISW